MELDEELYSEIFDDVKKVKPDFQMTGAKGHEAEGFISESIFKFFNRVVGPVDIKYR